MEVDFGKAMDAFKVAAEQGDVACQHDVGNMYCDGQGCEVSIYTRTCARSCAVAWRYLRHTLLCLRGAARA